MYQQEGDPFLLLNLVTERIEVDAILLQILNGLDKGGAYALIALGLTLIFGTLGVVNFAHGALFILGTFCTVTVNKVITLSAKVRDESVTFFEAYGGRTLRCGRRDGFVDYQLVYSHITAVAIPVMLGVGLAMERGLIRHFYKRPHADQILVTLVLPLFCRKLLKLLWANQFTDD